MQIAIIGAGMAGLSCAMRLRSAGHEVALFDKGRGPGGRMSTRRMEVDGETLRFDHGAQYFTARDPNFIEQVKLWERAGVAARWSAGGEDAWVGTPGMNGPIRAMAETLGVQFNSRIDALERTAKGWQLLGEGMTGAAFDVAVVAVPAEQAGPLLNPHDGEIASLAEQTESHPCWTLMVAFDSPIPFEADAIRDRGAIGWAARNSSKPQRGPAECWVVQANSEWSRDHLEEDKQTIEALLFEHFSAAIGADLPHPIAISSHRWRYARSGAAGLGHFWNGELSLGACGDWMIAPRVEAAWLSGRALADRIIAH